MSHPSVAESLKSAYEDNTIMFGTEETESEKELPA